MSVWSMGFGLVIGALFSCLPRPLQSHDVAHTQNSHELGVQAAQYVSMGAEFTCPQVSDAGKSACAFKDKGFKCSVKLDTGYHCLGLLPGLYPKRIALYIPSDYLHFKGEWILHFHGYLSSRPETFLGVLDEKKLGFDFLSYVKGSGRKSILVVPESSDKNATHLSFLSTASNFSQLIAGLNQIITFSLWPNPIKSIVLTGHSGGGLPIERIMSERKYFSNECHPKEQCLQKKIKEIHLFDALYTVGGESFANNVYRAWLENCEKCLFSHTAWAGSQTEGYAFRLANLLWHKFPSFKAYKDSADHEFFTLKAGGTLSRITFLRKDPVIPEHIKKTPGYFPALEPHWQIMRDNYRDVLFAADKHFK